ncbi:hypothetical protein HMPREF9970_1824, partial [Lachnoanaerobaculum saburreum F0468]
MRFVYNQTLAIEKMLMKKKKSLSVKQIVIII